MTHEPLISILICSYNYERYVGATIASALAQTWPRVEVVVVDDGSTDGSWGVIESFGGRIKAIRQANGGQGAAYNTCFANASGDWVIWLDCDDLLDPDCLARCVERMQDAIHKVAFAMRVVDAESQPTGNQIPYTMHEGDVTAVLRTFGIYGGPPGSGNLYRRSAIERYFPLDVKVWPMCADTVPFVVCGALGPVAAIHEPAGSYRIHRKANKALGLFGNVLGSLVETLVLDDKRRVTALAMVADIFPNDARRALLPIPSLMRTRVISWKIARAAHPYPEDSIGSLIRLAWRSLTAWPGFGIPERLASMAWTLAVLFVPRSLAAMLVRMNASDDPKRQLRRWSSSPSTRR